MGFWGKQLSRIFIVYASARDREFLGERTRCRRNGVATCLPAIHLHLANDMLHFSILISTSFAGLIMERHTQYSQKITRPFRLTMASLDIGSSSKSSNSTFENRHRDALTEIHSLVSFPLVQVTSLGDYEFLTQIPDAMC